MKDDKEISGGAKELAELRKEIDSIDYEMISILEKRFGVVSKIAEVKKRNRIPITDISRQNEILRKIAPFRNRVDSSFLEELFQIIFDYSKVHQLEKKNNDALLDDLKARPLVIAGPCSVESCEQITAVSDFLAKKGVKFVRGGIFKPRTDPKSFQGLGVDGLIILREAADRNGQYIVCEVTSPKLLDIVYDFIDVIQIGSRSMTSFELLKYVGKKTAKDKKPVLLKRGMSATIGEFLKAMSYITQYGNDNVILCLRGIRTFEQIESDLRNTPDLSAIFELKENTDKIVIFDPSHAAGNTKYVAHLAKAALSLGADGIMVEVHNNPGTALCDGKQSLDFSQFDGLLDEVRESRK